MARPKANRSPEWNLLPREKEKLAEMIRAHGDRETAILSYRRTMWLLANYYLNGMRRFDVFDPNTKTIVPFYLDQDGKLEFQSQELLSAVDRASAAIAAMDVRPKVERQGMSLRLVRDRSVAQVIADSLVSENQLETVINSFSHMLATLGSVGVSGRVCKGTGGRLRAHVEVIHPKEIMPFPTVGTDLTKVRGRMRQRMVTLDRLSDLLGSSVKGEVERMEAWEVGWSNPEEDPIQNRQGIFFSDERMVAGGWRETGDGVKMVRVREVWVDGECGTCARYVLASGDWIGEDLDMTGQERYCPIGWANCIPCSSFHGIGIFELLFPLAREVEKLMKTLFSNARDLDRMGALVIPNGHFNERAMLRDAGNGLRVMNWSPEPGQEGQRPFHVPPPTTGDFPGRVAQMGREMMREINPIRDLLKEKGRVDSTSGLQFLDEQVRQGMTNPTRGVQQAFGSMWRSVCGEAAQMLMLDQSLSIPVVNMTVELAGAVIDMDEGSLSFERNPIPNIGSLNFTVRHVSPRSEVARKQEALELLKLGLNDPDTIRLLALKEGLDFATWSDEDASAYEQVVRNILVLYGNGTDPGGLWLTPHTSRPDFQLRVLNAFMSGPHMASASKAVVDAFIQYKLTLVGYLGQTLPESVPNPDDMAAFANPTPPMAAGAAGQFTNADQLPPQPLPFAAG